MEAYVEGLPAQAPLPLAGLRDWSQRGTQPSPGAQECLCCRTETIRRIPVEKELYALSTSPPPKVAPPPWPLANPATLFLPTLHIQLVMLCPSWLQSCARMPALARPPLLFLDGHPAPSVVPLTSPHSPDGSLTATSPFSTILHFPLAQSPALVQALGTCLRHPLSLFPYSRVPSLEITA